MQIGIVDDGLGFVPALAKLRQAVSAEFVCLVCGEHFPLGNQSGALLMSVGTQAVRKLRQMGCDAVVFSSVALSSRCFKAFSSLPDVRVFGCEPPVLHGLTYTASNVLLVGDPFALRNQTLGGVLTVPMPQFAQLAEEGNERSIVEYVSELCEPFGGQFDCIALANSAMNLYKHCFARVFPGVKLFDSLEGVARRIRKTYKKQPREEGSFRVIDLDGNDIREKYTFFID